MRCLAGPSSTCHVQTAPSSAHMRDAVVQRLTGSLREHLSSNFVWGAILVLPLPGGLLLQQHAAAVQVDAMTTLLDLPPHLLLSILALLPPEDLYSRCAAAQTCRVLLDLASSPELWKERSSVGRSSQDGHHAAEGVLFSRIHSLLSSLLHLPPQASHAWASRGSCLSLTFGFKHQAMLGRGPRDPLRSGLYSRAILQG